MPASSTCIGNSQPHCRRYLRSPTAPARTYLVPVGPLRKKVSTCAASHSRPRPTRRIAAPGQSVSEPRRSTFEAPRGLRRAEDGLDAPLPVGRPPPAVAPPAAGERSAPESHGPHVELADGRHRPRPQRIDDSAGAQSRRTPAVRGRAAARSRYVSSMMTDALARLEALPDVLTLRELRCRVAMFRIDHQAQNPRPRVSDSASAWSRQTVALRSNRRPPLP